MIAYIEIMAELLLVIILQEASNLVDQLRQLWLEQRQHIRTHKHMLPGCYNARFPIHLKKSYPVINDIHQMH